MRPRIRVAPFLFWIAAALATAGTVMWAQVSENLPAGKVYVEGEICVSSDDKCGASEIFVDGEDIKIKGGIPGIYFEETFGSEVDWMIETQQDKFVITDHGTDGSSDVDVFIINAGAPASSLSIDSSGNVGMGTSTPGQELHLAFSSPSIRFEDTDGSQVWDVSGNSTGFRVRDNTAGSQNRLWIQPGTGNVGIGTTSPDVKLHVIGETRIEGDFSVLSSREAKEILSPVSARELLAALEQLPIVSWRYEADSDGAVHLGPTSEAFHAAFGLGRDERHISPVDLSGVAIAAIQGLHEVVREREAEIEELKESRDHLAARLEALETGLARGMPPAF